MKAKKVVLVQPVTDEDILRLPRGQRAPEGWVRTHSTSRYSMWIRENKGNARLTILPTKRAYLLGAQHGVEPRWVGQCKFAFYVVEEEA